MKKIILSVLGTSATFLLVGYILLQQEVYFLLSAADAHGIEQQFGMLYRAYQHCAGS